MVKELIGEDFGGVLGSDFYAGYNSHQDLHQRCWVHFLRDVHELKEQHPHDEQLWRWAKSVKAIYDEAVAWLEHGPIRILHHANRASLTWHDSMPSSSACGSSVLLM